MRKFTSAGLPAPSTSTRSARTFSRPKLSSTAPINDGFIAAYSRARAVAMRFPCTITCAPTSVSGFSSTGFMSVCGSTPAASAWSAWARPISPPSTVTAALFDMFCGLNGSTRRPRSREGAREAGDDERLAHVRAGPLDHQCARHRVVLRTRRRLAP
ncbi:hypothetical protein ACVW0I_003193 [Bradyrhizobium sp. LM6.11]